MAKPLVRSAFPPGWRGRNRETCHGHYGVYTGICLRSNAVTNCTGERMRRGRGRPRAGFARCDLHRTATKGGLAMNNPFASCIQACSACAIACETCASACLREEDVSMMADCIRLDRDCADLCRLAETLMTRQSDLARELCRLCAQACRACAEECARHDHDHCQQCAQACQRCADECDAMAA